MKRRSPGGDTGYTVRPILTLYTYIAILVFCHFACKMPNHAHFLVNFGGSYPQNITLIILTPKRHILGWKRVVWVIRRWNPSRGSTWARAREKKVKTGQRTNKKGTLAVLRYRAVCDFDVCIVKYLYIHIRHKTAKPKHAYEVFVTIRIFCLRSLITKE